MPISYHISCKAKASAHEIVELINEILLQEKVGQGKKCDAALQRLRGKNADISQEAAEIRVTNLLHFLMSGKKLVFFFKFIFLKFFGAKIE